MRRAIGGMNRPTGWLAWSLCALSLMFVIVWASFRFLNSPTPTGINQSPLLVEIWGKLLSVSVAAVGALVASRQPKNTIGWIFCAIGLITTSSVASAQYAIYALVSSPGSLPLEERELGERFGVPYRRYCELVPRFVPRRKPVRQRDLNT